jgi:hypothetical protein
MNIEELATGSLGGAVVGAVLHVFNRLWSRSQDAEAMVRGILKHNAEECEARYRALLAAVDERLNDVDRRLDRQRPIQHEEVVHGE